MRQIARCTPIVALVVLLPMVAAAETFTVTLDNGNSILTRYQPVLSMPDEATVHLLTDMGNWISLPRDSVVSVTTETESRGFGRVIDTTTISLGFAPNETELTAGETPSDPMTELLRYLSRRDSAPVRDYSVQQFVDTESAGLGGFPSSYGSGYSSSGSPGSFVQPGSFGALPAPGDVQ